MMNSIKLKTGFRVPKSLEERILRMTGEYQR